MTKLDRDNLLHLRTMDTAALASLFLSGFADPDLKSFGPLKFWDDPSIPVQLVEAYRKLEPIHRDKFIASLTSSFARWAPNISSELTIHQDALALIELLFLAEMTQAASFVLPLQAIYYSGKLDHLSDDDFEAVMFEILGVLISLAFFDVDRVSTFFEQLFFSTGDKYNGRFDDRYAGQLLLGLCKCNPRQYPQYLPRFLDIVERNSSSTFDLDYTFAKFAELVTLKTFVDYLNQVSDNDVARIMKRLCDDTNSPFSYDIVVTPVGLYAEFEIREYVVPSEIFLMYNPRFDFGYEPLHYPFYSDKDDRTHRYLNIIYPFLTVVSKDSFALELLEELCSIHVP